MARLFVSGHGRACREQGWRHKRFPLQSCRRAGGAEPGAQPCPPQLARLLQHHSSCRAQLDPRALQIHPCTSQRSQGQAGSQEGARLGSHIPWSSQHSPPGHSTQERKLLLPPLGRVRMVLQLWGRLSFLQPDPEGGLCLYQCSCEVPQMQPSCSKPKRAPNSVNQTVPPTSASSIPSNKVSTSNKTEWGCKMQSTC